MRYEKISSFNIESLFKKINKIENPIEEKTIYEIQLDTDIVFTNKLFYTKDLLLSEDSTNSFPIKIYKNTGLMFCYLSNSELKNSILEKLVQKFQEEDTAYIKYTIHPRRIYANGLELAVKEIKNRGIIAIYCRENIPYRGDTKNTKKCILDILKNEN